MAVTFVLDGLDDNGLEPVVAVQEPGTGDELAFLIASPDEEQFPSLDLGAGVSITGRPPEDTHSLPLLRGPRFPAIFRNLQIRAIDGHKFVWFVNATILIGFLLDDVEGSAGKPFTH